MPADTDIENIFSPIEDDLIIAMTMDYYYYPFYNVNTIGNRAQHSAYKVKTNEEVSLNIIGAMEENKTLQLTEGWNLVPVISTCPVDVEELFAQVVANLEIVKDVAGYGIYWPVMGINTLGTLNPGEAYYVLVSNPVSVNFGECTKTTYPEENLTGFQNLLGLVPWQLTRPTPSSHTIAIMPEAIKGFDPDPKSFRDYREGSIIGAFDQTGKCFGVAQVTKGTTHLALFGDDPFSTEKDGFESGETIAFKLFNPTTNEQVDLVSQFDQALPDANTTFVDNGMSLINRFSVETQNFASLLHLSNQIIIHPNPTTGLFTVSGIDENTQIEILDMHGRPVRCIRRTAVRLIQHRAYQST